MAKMKKYRISLTAVLFGFVSATMLLVLQQLGFVERYLAENFLQKHYVSTRSTLPQVTALATEMVGDVHSHSVAGLTPLRKVQI